MRSARRANRIKLPLSRETLRALTPEALARVAGGIPPDYTDRCTRNCSDRCPEPTRHCTALCWTDTIIID